LAESSVKRSPQLEQILSKAAPRHEPEVEDAMRDVRAAIAAPMLDLIFKDGWTESFSYVLLARVRFDPTGRLMLYFGDEVVVIEGRNLADIRQKVRLHKASEILEGTDAQAALKAEGEPHVERIYLTNVFEIEKGKQ
jgi:hypothetical protein